MAPAKKIKGKGRIRRRRGPRPTGAFGLSIAEAGAMIGLTRSAAYRAAAAGEIPTITAGRNKLVPRLIWERMLGIPPTPAAAARADETETRVESADA